MIFDTECFKKCIKYPYFLPKKEIPIFKRGFLELRISAFHLKLRNDISWFFIRSKILKSQNTFFFSRKNVFRGVVEVSLSKIFNGFKFPFFSGVYYSCVKYLQQPILLFCDLIARQYVAFSVFFTLLTRVFWPHSNED